MERNWLPERLQSARNLIDIAQILYAMNRDDLLPTILELLYAETEFILQEHCIVNEEDRQDLSWLNRH